MTSCTADSQQSDPSLYFLPNRVGLWPIPDPVLTGASRSRGARGNLLLRGEILPQSESQPPTPFYTQGGYFKDRRLGNLDAHGAVHQYCGEEFTPSSGTNASGECLYRVHVRNQ